MLVCSQRQDGFGKVAIRELVQTRKVSIHASLYLSSFLLSPSSTEVRTLYLIVWGSYQQGGFKLSPKARLFIHPTLFRRGVSPALICSHQLPRGWFSFSFPGF